MRLFPAGVRSHAFRNPINSSVPMCEGIVDSGSPVSNHVVAVRYRPNQSRPPRPVVPTHPHHRLAHLPNMDPSPAQPATPRSQPRGGSASTTDSLRTVGVLGSAKSMRRNSGRKPNAESRQRIDGEAVVPVTARSVATSVTGYAQPEGPRP
jgi:hypothetical protein